MERACCKKERQSISIKNLHSVVVVVVVVVRLSRHDFCRAELQAGRNWISLGWCKSGASVIHPRSEMLTRPCAGIDKG